MTRRLLDEETLIVGGKLLALSRAAGGLADGGLLVADLDVDQPAVHSYCDASAGGGR